MHHSALYTLERLCVSSTFIGMAYHTHANMPRRFKLPGGRVGSQWQGCQGIPQRDALSVLMANLAMLPYAQSSGQYVLKKDGEAMLLC